MTRTEFVVVGGGVAGLVVARRLALRGGAVVVLEAEDRLGGQVAEHRVGGIGLDAGAESFATRGGSVAALLSELGLADDIVTPDRVGGWVVGARGAAPLPATGLLGIPADLGDPALDVILGGAGAERARRDATLSPGIGSDARTLGALVRARMGDEVLTELVAPVVRGVYSRDPDGLDLDGALPTLRAELERCGSLSAAAAAIRTASPAGSQVGGIRGGMMRLAAALVTDCERLGVDLRTGIRAVEVAEDGVVAARVGRVGGTPVLATEPPGRGSDGARHLRIATLVVVAPDLDAAPRGTGVLVAASAGIAARALTHSTAKWRWIADAAAGHHAVRLSYDVDGPGATAATPREDAERLLGVRFTDVLDADAMTWRRPRTDGPAPADGIARTGETVAGTGLAAVVAHAETTAASLIPDSRPAPADERMDA